MVNGRCFTDDDGWSALEHDDGATLHEERESESKEKAHSSLIQTGVSFSLDLQGRQ